MLISTDLSCIRQVTIWFCIFSIMQILHDFTDVHPAACTDDTVNTRNVPAEISAVSLCQAAGGNQHLTAFLLSC